MKLLNKLQLRGQKPKQKDKTALAPNALSPGTPAPDFSLSGNVDGPIHLQDYRGRPVILAFYPADNTSVCSNQMALYNEALPLFDEFDAQLLAISVDDPPSHKQFATDLNLNFPLLSDNAPKGSVAQSFGVFNREREQTHRALFVIDAEGVVRWSEVVPAQVNPGAHGILAALEDVTNANQ